MKFNLDLALISCDKLRASWIQRVELSGGFLRRLEGLDNRATLKLKLFLTFLSHFHIIENLIH